MSHLSVLTGVRHLRSLLAAQHGHEQSDEQLLTAFADRGDETAFATLVRRHGPMVLGVCRRILGHEQDAEDAFQAVFLVLARRAAVLRSRIALAGFLHGTAYHLASKVRRAACRRRKYEGRSPARPNVKPSDEVLWREVRVLLDEETARLPEKYRNAFILCYLEGLTQSEAARRLGMKERTVSNRLAEARRRMQGRLRRRGVELTAVLAAALMAQSASALPIVSRMSLAQMASPAAVALAESLSPLWGLSKAKLATGLLLVVTLVGGAGGWFLDSGERRDVSPSVFASTGDLTPRRSPKSVTVHGRVLDPEGKPVRGARLHWPRIPEKEPESELDVLDIEIPQRAQTDADGRFRFELPRSDIKPDWNLSLVAAADGYGVAWTNSPTIEAGGELTLRLVKDHPIEGRIINTEGKPQAGVRMMIGELGTNPDGKLDLFLGAWQRDWRMAPHRALDRMFLPLDKILNPVTTAKDGSFRITGAGAERLVVLYLRGSGNAFEELHVVNRAGFDAAPLNKAVLDRIPPELRIPGQPTLLYGPKLTYVRPPSRRIEGTIREAGSGKPVAGYRIGMVVSDKEGRYRLDGVRKEREYLLNFEPPENTSWLRAGARIADTQGVQPLTIDTTAARGIVLSGRVIDKTTGKGVKCSIRFAPLLGNKFADKPGYDSYKYERYSNEADVEGRFRFPVIPGPGVLLVGAEGGETANGGRSVNPYKQAELDAKEREHLQITENEDGSYITAADNSIESLSLQNAVKYLDLAPEAGTAHCEILLTRAPTMRVKIADGDGKPLAGATVAGIAAWGNPMTIKDSSCTVFSLNPKKPRQLILYHAERNLAGSLTIRGAEKETPVARLVPTGCVIGRLLDRDGQPIVGADIEVSSNVSTADELYRDLQQGRPLLRTAKDGRFRIDGIVPEVKFILRINSGRTFLVGEPRIGERTVKAGETLDLGAIRVQPAR